MLKCLVRDGIDSAGGTAWRSPGGRSTRHYGMHTRGGRRTQCVIPCTRMVCEQVTRATDIPHYTEPTQHARPRPKRCRADSSAQLRMLLAAAGNASRQPLRSARPFRLVLLLADGLERRASLSRAQVSQGTHRPRFESIIVHTRLLNQEHVALHARCTLATTLARASSAPSSAVG